MYCFIHDDFFLSQNAQLPVDDLAIQRGYGVFDFFKIINGRPLFLEDHLNRFYQSAHELFLKVPYDRSALKDIIYTLIQKNGLAVSGIRITLTGGTSPDGYHIGHPTLIITEKIIEENITFQETAYRIKTYSYRRPLPKVKSIDYLVAVWLLKQFEGKGFNDILYQYNSEVLECPRANIFLVMPDDTILTPSENILEGITRKKLMEIAGSHFPVKATRINMDDLARAREVFITSTTKILLPVTQVDQFSFTNTKVSKVLFDLFRQTWYV